MLRVTRCLVAVVLFSYGIFPEAVAAPFENLDFEDSTLVPAPDEISIAPWSINDGGSETLLNLACLGAPQCVFVHDGGPPSGFLPLEGTYSVLLQSGTETDDVTSISQVGDVPNDGKSIIFLADDISAVPSFGGLRILLDGVALNLLELSTVGSATEFGANVPSILAGTTAELRVEVFRADGDEQNILVDAFSFSSQPVPEPPAVMLSVIGVLALIGYVRHRRP